MDPCLGTRYITGGHFKWSLIINLAKCVISNLISGETLGTLLCFCFKQLHVESSCRVVQLHSSISNISGKPGPKAEA